MENLPDFSGQEYRVLQELGRNSVGGRVVYLAESVGDDSKQVVIKQFQFARGGNWLEFKAIEREMQTLKDLNHPGIPAYLGSFETDDGFCIVQEYKNAQPLSVPRSFDPDEVKQIAVSVLEILIYLQSRIPPIIHRDIKPENVLVDEQLNVYLIDFGFARIGGGEVAMSSVAMGTFGFMAPEQIYNKGLTEATDLYGLGAMLIALLTNTKSTAMDTLIDDNSKISFRHLLPKLSLQFIEWLEKMVKPKLKDRYTNAESALKALKSLHVPGSLSFQLSHFISHFNLKIFIYSSLVVVGIIAAVILTQDRSRFSKSTLRKAPFPEAIATKAPSPAVTLPSQSVPSTTLIDQFTPGYYNDRLGDLYPSDHLAELFRGKDPLAEFFRGPDGSTNAPDKQFLIAPNLDKVDRLKNWLSNPEAAISNDFWLKLSVIPKKWTVNTETAIIYEVDGGEYGFDNVIGNFGVDNGIFVWVNGIYKFGATAGGTAVAYEYANIPLGKLNPGKNFIQILRADNGVSTGYEIKVTGDRLEKAIFN